ncbi:MutS protein msh4 [Irineochytrium annulatum]|nr:MutS protein msh4 [Irineochytrium annulatum]
MSATAVGPVKSSLCERIEEATDVAVLPVNRKYYANACVGALFSYVQEHKTVMKSTLKFKYLSMEGHLTIDAATAKNLELVRNNMNKNSSHSLVGILDKTCTPMGAKLLKRTILNPARIKCQRGEVRHHYTPYRRQDVLQAITVEMKTMIDIDQLLSVLASQGKKQSVKLAEIYINAVIMLKHTIKGVLRLKEPLASIKNDLISAIFTIVSHPAFDTFEEIINSRMNEDISYQKNAVGLKNQRCYAVRADSLKHNMNFRIIYSASQKYVLQLNVEQLAGKELPPEFINVNRSKKVLTFTTLQLYLMSDRIVIELINDIRKDIGILFKLSESLAMLDMLASFSQVAKASNYVRPEFTETREINVSANDWYSPSCDDTDSAALLTIMAHIGSFVPAEYASFRIHDNIFTRIGSDSEDSTVSGFMLEMGEAAFILQNATENSLVIVDELGRGSSSSDGLGLTVAIIEELLKLKCFTFFATHFTELMSVTSMYPNAVNLHLSVETTDMKNGEGVRFRYLVKDGSSTESHYGIIIASLVSIPAAVVNKARVISDKYEEISEQRKQGGEVQKRQRRRQAKTQIIQRLIQARKDANLDDSNLRAYLRNIQKEAVKCFR